jgi:hypothetical protein
MGIEALSYVGFLKNKIKCSKEEWLHGMLCWCVLRGEDWGVKIGILFKYLESQQRLVTGSDA